MKKKNEHAFVSTDAMSFEEALAGLEQTVLKLERDNLTLSSALESFEQGIGFMRVCEQHLCHAEGKLKELLKGENGELVEKILGNASATFDNEELHDE
jgi:exodeoxyribonuclease VII small subunit